MNACAPQCLTFGPYIAGPVGPVNGVEDDPLSILSVSIFGTLPFNVSVCTSPSYPSLSPVVASISFAGNVMTINFNTPTVGDAGTYNILLCVTNAYCCDPLQIPVTVIITPAVAPPS